MGSLDNFEEYVTLGIQIRTEKDDCAWRLGDLANELQQKCRDGFVAAQYAKLINMHRSTLCNYMMVAAMFDVSLRKQYEAAPYTFFRLARQAFPDNLQRAISLIEKALDEDMSCDRLAKYIQDQHPGEPTKIMLTVNGDVRAMAQKIRDAMPDTYRQLGEELVSL
jgi:hypothetical protein